MQDVDVLITNGWVVTVDSSRREYRPGFVAITQDRISSVGPMDQCPDVSVRSVIDAAGSAVLPGLINSHTHAIYTLLRGGPSDDRPLYDWLLNVVHPGLKAITADNARAAISLFCAEAIRSGITTFVDNADSARFAEVAESTLATYERFGVRAIYARMFADYMPDSFDEYTETAVAKEPQVQHYLDGIEDTRAVLENIEALIHEHHGRAEGRLSIWPAPGVAGFMTPQGLLGAKDIARRSGTMVTTHVAESAMDRQIAGMSTVEYLDMIGFLGSEVLAVHCVQADTKDVRILADTGTRVAHSPVSNLFLASGVAPIAEMARAGVVLSIGTDDPNCNSSVNLISDMKFAALLQKGRYQDAAAITSERVLEMATIEGAAAIGMADSIGSLEPNKQADVIVVDLRLPQMVPVHHVPSAVVYQASGEEVRDVIVDGRILMRNRQLTMLDGQEAEALVDQAQRASDEVLEKAGLTAMRSRGWISPGAPTL